MKQYDVIVAGGGFAGAAAALAAAREGLSVLLFDKSNCLGGAAVNCLVNPFMPYTTQINGKTTELSQGIFKKIRDSLYDMRKQTGEMQFPEKINMFSEEHLKVLLNRMMRNAGVELLFHVYLCGVSSENGNIKNVLVASKSGILTLKADYFIDATGDGLLAAMSGCNFRLGRPQDGLCQPMTLCFRLSNVDIDKYKEQKDEIQKKYRQFKSEGKIKNPREDILVFNMPQKGVLHFNTTRIVKLNPTDPFDVTRAELEVREQAFEIYCFLKDNFESFKNCELIYTAPEIGVRESRMIDGLYTLTGQDLRACARFDDSVALGNYDIDIHNPEGEGTSHYYFPAGQYYEIPYRCLVPKDTGNLLVAGRCISVDHEAQASIRIMPIVCCLGEAAGAAAAAAKKDGVSFKDADIAKIQRILTANGAIIHAGC